MPTEAKKAWIRSEAEAGVPEIEVGSFVPAKILPQLADTAGIVAYARTIPGLTVAVLVPNARGAANALAAGAHKITLPLSVSKTHSLKNLNRTHAQVLEEVVQVRALINQLPENERPSFEGSLSTAFGCTIEGPVAQDDVVRLAVELMRAGCDEVGLSDTTGYGNPRQVKDLTRAVRAEVGDDKLNGIHLHNTRGQRQYCYGRPGIHARGHGPANRHRYRQVTGNPRAGGSGTAEGGDVWIPPGCGVTQGISSGGKLIPTAEAGQR